MPGVSSHQSEYIYNHDCKGVSNNKEMDACATDVLQITTQVVVERDLPMPIVLGAGLTPAKSRKQNSDCTCVQPFLPSCAAQVVVHNFLVVVHNFLVEQLHTRTYTYIRWPPSPCRHKLNLQ